jgi:hypothetical protein
MKEHLVPAGYLPLQLGLQRMTFAEDEAIHALFPGFPARKSRLLVCSFVMVPDLPAVALFCVVLPCMLLVAQEEHLLYHLHPVSPVLRGRVRTKGLEEASLPSGSDANGYQAT